MKGFFAVVVLVVGFLFFVPEAKAIPAWSKKYNVDCSTCHAGPMYKLTPMGAEFLRRGHRLPGDETTKELDKLVSINTKLRAHNSDAPGRNFSFEVHAFSVYTGGILTEKFSYFAEMYLYENTGKTSGAVNSDFGRSKLADAYLMYNSNPDGNSYTTVKFGQISPSQLLIYWNVGPRYSETRPYIVNNSTVSPNTYRPFLRNFGAEAAHTLDNWHASVGVLNGTGAGTTNSTDNNAAKDLYATLDVTYDDNGSTFGLYGYKGKGKVTPTSGPIWENHFYRIGAFNQYVVGPLNLTSVVTRGEEEVSAENKFTKNLGLLFEVDYEFTEELAIFGRYDYFDPNVDKSDDDLAGPVFGATYRFFEPGRAVFEYHKQGKGTSRPWEYRLEVAFTF